MGQYQQQTQVQQTREGKQFQLRLPDDLKNRIDDHAKAIGSSINTEIIKVLLKHFPPPKFDVSGIDGVIDYISATTSAASRADRIREVNRRFAAMASLLRIEDHGGVLVIVTEG